jgi:hypothetical protein
MHPDDFFAPHYARGAIGAHEPRWFMRGQHVKPEESHQAFLDLEAAWMITMHWGCFDLTDEPPDPAP